MGVAIIYSFNDLIDEAFDKVWGKFLFDLSEVFLKVILNVFEDKVERVMSIDDFFKPKEN